MPMMHYSVHPDFRTFCYSRLGRADADYGIVQHLIYHMMRSERYALPNNVYFDVLTGDPPNYFGVTLQNTVPLITYTTVEKLKKTGDMRGKMYQQGGHCVAMKPARFAQQITGITDGHALDVFASAFTAYFAPTPSTFAFVEGYEIGEKYRGSNYCQCAETGDLWGSCMRYDDIHDRDVTAVYQDVARLAVLLCDECGGVCARTVVWPGNWYDRVYSNRPSTYHAMLLKLEEHGLQDAYHTDDVALAIPYPTEHNEFPYTDTIKLRCVVHRVLLTDAAIDQHTQTHPDCRFRDMKSVPYSNGRVRNRPNDMAECQCGEALQACGHCYDCDYVYCEACDESWCSECEDECDNGCTACGAYGCHARVRYGYSVCTNGHVECGDCGAYYNDNYESCPNEHWCDEHSCDFHGDVCPEQETCTYCDEAIADQWGDCLDTCENERCPSNITALVVYPSAWLATVNRETARGQTLMPQYQELR